MTILQPAFFLVALGALPILVLLYFWQRRPRPVRVPSIEVWQQVIKRLPETVVRMRRRRWPDPRLWVALLVLVLLALAAGDVSLVREAPEPREVRVVLDRSLWMQLPLATDGGENGAWPLALESAASVLESSLRGGGGGGGASNDRVSLELVPPLAPGELSQRDAQRLTAERDPARLAAALRAVHAGEIALEPADSAAQGAYAAALADALTWSAQEPRRRVLALTTQPVHPTRADVAVAHENDDARMLALVRWPLSLNLVHLHRLALDEHDILVELVAPAQRNVTLQARALDNAGVVRTDVAPVRHQLAAAATPEEEALVLRRAVLPRPDGASTGGSGDGGGVEVRVLNNDGGAVAAAVPAWRAVLAQPLRVAVRLPVALGEETATAWLDWLATLFPGLIFERMPREGEVELLRPDVLLTASAGTLYEHGLGTAPPPAWQDVPRLVIGPVPAPANPFVAEQVAPEPLAVTPRRRVDYPSHALLRDVALAHVQLPDAHRLERGLGLTRFEPVLSAELDPSEAPSANARNDNGDEDVDEPRFTPLIVAAENGQTRGVLIAGSTQLTRWPQMGGMADVLLLANAFAYLLGESSRADVFEDSQAAGLRATLAGEPFELPAWAASRRDRAAPLQYAWRPDQADDDDEEAGTNSWREVESLSEVRHRGGWIRVALPDESAQAHRTVLPRQAGRLAVDTLQAAQATPDDATQLPEPEAWLPQSRTEAVQHGRMLWLLLALLAALLYAVVALRPRR